MSIREALRKVDDFCYKYPCSECKYVNDGKVMDCKNKFRIEEIRKLIPKKKESNHQEDGECGCKYMEDGCFCEFEANSRNETIDEVNKKLFGDK